MFSGRMNDLVQQKNTKLYDQFGFAAPPAVFEGGKAYSTVSTDGWSIPFNTKVDKDLLFEVIGASVSQDASQASVPAAFPARTTVDQSASPYAAATKDSLAKGPTKEIQPYVPAVSEAIRPVLANYMAGKIDVPRGAAADAGRGREGHGRPEVDRLRVGPSSRGPPQPGAAPSGPTCHRSGRGARP